MSSTKPRARTRPAPERPLRLRVEVGPQPILVVTSAGSRDRERLVQILSATRREVHFVSTVDDALARMSSRVYAFAIVDLALPGDEPRLLEELRADGATPALLLADGLDRRQLAELLRGGASLITEKGSPTLAEELVITAHKLLSGDLFGLEKYLTWGAVPGTVVLSSSEERHAVVDELAEHARLCGLDRRHVLQARTIADELLTNAIYSAPVLPDGSRVFAGRRESEAWLDEDHPVELRYACDGRFFALSVADQYGSLQRDRVTSTLARCLQHGASVDDGASGAGLGLYLAFEYSQKLVINVAPGVCTEILALLDLSERELQQPGQRKSFHLFEQPEPRLRRTSEP